MSIQDEPATLEWVAVGGRAFGLVHRGRIAALVYWEGAEVAEHDGPGGEPVVTAPGFAWVPTDVPWSHFYLFEAPEPADGDWKVARDRTAWAYFGWLER